MRHASSLVELPSAAVGGPTCIFRHVLGLKRLGVGGVHLPLPLLVACGNVAAERSAQAGIGPMTCLLCRAKQGCPLAVRVDRAPTLIFHKICPFNVRSNWRMLYHQRPTQPDAAAPFLRYAHVSPDPSIRRHTSRLTLHKLEQQAQQALVPRQAQSGAKVRLAGSHQVLQSTLPPPASQTARRGVQGRSAGPRVGQARACPCSADTCRPCRLHDANQACAAARLTAGACRWRASAGGRLGWLQSAAAPAGTPRGPSAQAQGEGSRKEWRWALAGAGISAGPWRAGSGDGLQPRPQTHCYASQCGAAAPRPPCAFPTWLCATTM